MLVEGLDGIEDHRLGKAVGFQGLAAMDREDEQDAQLALIGSPVGAPYSVALSVGSAAPAGVAPY